MNYKKNRIILLVAIVLGVLVFIIKINFTTSSRKAKQNVNNIEKVKIGMTKAEVINVMGTPNAKQMSFFNSNDSVYFYKPPFGASSGIYIQFEDSSDVVNQIIPYE